MNIDVKENYKQALIAMARSYSPYSKFKVGAAIKLKNGGYVLGTNVENGSYTVGTCAERNALFSLYAQGYTKADIESLTVVADYKTPISPCGACRQVIAELVPKEAKIYLTNLQGMVTETTIDALLPFGFELDHE